MKLIVSVIVVYLFGKAGVTAFPTCQGISDCDLCIQVKGCYFFQLKADLRFFECYSKAAFDVNRMQRSFTSKSQCKIAKGLIDANKRNLSVLDENFDHEDNHWQESNKPIQAINQGKPKGILFSFFTFL